MAMVDMKRSKVEKKANDQMHLGKPGGDDYHHGLTVHLDHESLGKLGIDKLPNVGDVMHMKAHAHVKEVSEEHRDGGKKNRRVVLELRKMEAAAVKKASEQDVTEGNLKGAKAAMDQALDKQEMGGKKKGGYDAAAATDDDEDD